MFETKFWWFGSGSQFSFVWSEILFFMWPRTARIRERVLFGAKYYCVCGLGLLGSGNLYLSYTVQNHLALEEKQGVDVVTAALTSVRNALQKPEIVYDRWEASSHVEAWFEQPFWMK